MEKSELSKMCFSNGLYNRAELIICGMYVKCIFRSTVSNTFSCVVYIQKRIYIV